jgi:ADP-ribose pyrophosphatase
MSNVKSIYKGRVLDINIERIRLPNGNDVDLEIVRHPGGACALPLHDDGDVTLIRQYRQPAGEIIWEIPAGRIDAGEDPESCARRELEEEAGLTAGRMEKLSSFMTTPGFCSEVLHIYLAKDLIHCGQRLEHDESLEVVKLPIRDAMKMVLNGEINDGKTMIALLLAKERMLMGRLQNRC